MNCAGPLRRHPGRVIRAKRHGNPFYAVELTEALADRDQRSTLTLRDGLIQLRHSECDPCVSRAASTRRSRQDAGLLSPLRLSHSSRSMT